LPKGLITLLIIDQVRYNTWQNLVNL